MGESVCPASIPSSSPPPLQRHRRHPGHRPRPAPAPGAGKKTTLVVPVYLRQGLSTTGLLKGSAFENLLTLLQALRADDTPSWIASSCPPAGTAAGLRPGPPSAPVPNGPRNSRVPSAWRSLCRPRHLGGVPRLRPPLPNRLRTPRRSCRLHRSRWLRPGRVSDQSLLATPCGLPARREQTGPGRPGVMGAAPARTFQSVLEHARVWAGVHGDLCVPVKDEVGGHWLGSWPAAQRRRARTGRLPHGHGQALEAIGPGWNPPGTDWHRRCIRARTLVATTGWEPAVSSTSPIGEHRAIVNRVLAQRLPS
ncbi:helicase associated domain-containing protein [Streptomyces sp. NPDC048483]|uniref:helicase associated domain-containing protein n=1 Tax=Streptomyces sp. NPDC048483 TaxID=3154927 RepID=UPI00341B0727